jgi:hypothetical protein
MFVMIILNMLFTLLVCINFPFITLIKKPLMQCLNGYFRVMYDAGTIIKHWECQLTGGG